MPPKLCCVLCLLQDSCPPTYCQLMRKWLTFQSCLPLLMPLFTQLFHPQTKERNLLASLQQIPFVSTVIHHCQPVPILHTATFRVLTTPTRNWHRAGTGASLGTLGSKCVMARNFWISTDLWNERKELKKRKRTRTITVIHRALRRAMLMTQFLRTPLQLTPSLWNDVFISTGLETNMNASALRASDTMCSCWGLTEAGV